tara:strand:+ start:85 stop:948 length:864 start_codon:yes stop_codon:yes gene_type:complete
MTGFGRSDVQSDNVILSVEIRSLNSRFLDFSSRMPKSLSQFEDEAYRLVKERCNRGRVTLVVKIDFLSGLQDSLVLNKDKLQDYLKIINDIQKFSDQKQFPSIGEILRLPEIIKSENTLDEKEVKKIFIKALQNAINELDIIRNNEGKNIQVDISNRLIKLIDGANRIGKIVKENENDSFQRYSKKIQNLLKDKEIDDSRLYQEIAILSDRKDITEELVRLSSHYDLFSKYMNKEKNSGKKLNFLLQEISREINTITSKTDIVDVNHISVEMKHELEKIREQVQNIV